MNTLDRMIPEQTEFNSPDSSIIHSRLIDAFVDDTSLGFTDSGFLQLETMVSKKLQHIAQTWERLLFYSGGALNLTKCSWRVMFWDWKKGRPKHQISRSNRSYLISHYSTGRIRHTDSYPTSEYRQSNTHTGSTSFSNWEFLFANPHPQNQSWWICRSPAITQIDTPRHRNVSSDNIWTLNEIRASDSGNRQRGIGTDPVKGPCINAPETWILK